MNSFLFKKYGILIIIVFILITIDIIYLIEAPTNHLNDIKLFFTDNIKYLTIIILNLIIAIYTLIIFLRKFIIKIKTKPIVHIEKENLPYSTDVPTLFIHNYQGIHNMKFEIPMTSRWIFLTGENGFGKTNILQAIARVFSNEEDNRHYIGINPIQKDTSISLLSQHIRRTIELDSFNGFNAKFNFKVIGYGVGRLILGSESNRKEFKPCSGLFDNEVKLKNIEKEGISRWYFNDKNQFKKIQSIFKLLIHTLDHIEVDEDYNVWYIEKDNKSKLLPRVRFNNLATGFQNIISMVGDIYLNVGQFQKENKNRGYKCLVLIDELELFLHPNWQIEFPNILSNVFPDILFIATTHSPLPMLGVKDSSIIYRAKRSSLKGVTIERLRKLEKEVNSLLPNTILSSDIFGFDYLNSMIDKDFHNLHIEDKYDDIEKIKLINERLKKLDKEIYPDKLFES